MHPIVSLLQADSFIAPFQFTVSIAVLLLHVLMLSPHLGSITFSYGHTACRATNDF